MARLTARGDQDLELVSLVRNQQTSDPTVSTNGKVVTLQVIASLGADVELGDVTGAFLESAELSQQSGKLFLRQPSGGLPGLHPQQLLEIRLPLYGLNDSPKRRFLEISNFFVSLVGNLLLWMNVSSYSLIRIPRFWQGYCVCMWTICCWVAVAQPIVKRSMHHVPFSISQMEKKSRRILW